MTGKSQGKPLADGSRRKARLEEKWLAIFTNTELVSLASLQIVLEVETGADHIDGVSGFSVIFVLESRANCEGNGRLDFPGGGCAFI
jgi:hypothetical protein